MKCCECNKEVDDKVSKIPPTWYGAFRGTTMLAIICDDCVKDPKKKSRWVKGESWTADIEG